MDERTANEAVVAVRELARAGAPVTEMIRRVQLAVGTSRATVETIWIFKRVFDVPLSELMAVGTWVGLAHGNPGRSDAEIEAELGSKLRAVIRAAPG